jgi:hypothetical protein
MILKSAQRRGDVMPLDKLAYARKELATCQDELAKAEASKAAHEARVEYYDLERERCLINIEAIEEWIEAHPDE